MAAYLKIYAWLVIKNNPREKNEGPVSKESERDDHVNGSIYDFM